MSFVTMQLSEEPCSQLSNQVNRGAAASLAMGLVDNQGQSWEGFLLCPPGLIGSRELCSFPAVMHVSIMAFEMLFIWSFWHWSLN